MTSPTVHRVDLESVSLSVTLHPGDGPEILLIHGIGSSGADFSPVVAGMAAFSRPITLDLRGHGASMAPEFGYHYTDYVRDLEGLVSALGLSSPIVLGHSLGGIVALFWAARNPGAARGIIIEDSPLRSGPEFRESFEGWLQLNSLPREVVRAWYADKNPDWSDAVLDQRAHDMTHTRREAILELQAASMAGEGLDSLQGLENVHVPVLFMHGDGDSGSMVHPEDLARLPQRLRSIKIVRVPGAGHTIHRSHIDAWLAHVRDFVARLGS